MRKGALLIGALVLAAGVWLILPEDTSHAAPAEPQALEMRTDTETYEGRLVSVGTPLFGLAVPQSDNLATFTVSQGTDQLTLDLSADVTPPPPVAELDVLIAPPGCDYNTGCEETLVTDDGALAWSAEDPEPGQWSVHLFFHETSGGEADWFLDVTEEGLPSN